MEVSGDGGAEQSADKAQGDRNQAPAVGPPGDRRPMAPHTAAMRMRTMSPEIVSVMVSLPREPAGPLGLVFEQAPCP
jgi:hypothetical protein